MVAAQCSRHAKNGAIQAQRRGLGGMARRLLCSLQGAPGNIPLIVGGGVVRLQADRFVEVGDGGFVTPLPLGIFGKAAVVVGAGVVRQSCAGCA